MDDSGGLVRQVRKRCSAAEKRVIVEQTLEPGASVARMARAHGLNANVVFHWRGLYREGKLTALPEQAMKLLPVSVAEPEAVTKRPPFRINFKQELRPSSDIDHFNAWAKLSAPVQGPAITYHAKSLAAIPSSAS